ASMEFAMVTGADEDGRAPAKLSIPRSGIPRPSSPRSMATLLTLVETPFGVESCASSGAGTRAEVFSRESVADRGSGMSEAAIKARWEEAIGGGEGGQEARLGFSDRCTVSSRKIWWAL